MKKQQMILLVLSHNTKLLEVDLRNNNFETPGAIKITKSISNILTLLKYNLSGNNIHKETVNSLRDILSWNTKLNVCI